jgi:hypothetical protein
MKMKIKVTKDVEVKTLHVEAGVRYWEDATVNGVEDGAGDLIPFREGDYWKPVIDIETGKVLDWPQGVKADIHYKVCDDGAYTLKDENGETIKMIDGYVPKIMSPGGIGYGDYIIMRIDEQGQIDNWQPTLREFTRESD